MMHCILFRASRLAVLSLGALLPVRAADVSEYSVAKGHLHAQTSAAQVAEAASPYTFYARVRGNPAAITSAAVTAPPFGSQLELNPDGVGGDFIFAFPAANLGVLNQIFGQGSYTISVDSDNDGFSFAQLTLSSTTFPAAVPLVANYAAAQQIAADADFTLNFNGGAGTRFELELEQDGLPFWLATGTGSSLVIPAGTLPGGVELKGRLRFLNVVDEDTTSYPGATGLAYLYNETEFPLILGSGGGGGGDTTPPTLAIVFPASGSITNLPTMPVSFAFSEEMAPVHAIEWSANVNTAGLNYMWSDETTLVVFSITGFPDNATITWKLNPTAGGPNNFRDKVGNPLAMVQGSFSTGTGGGGPVDPCDGGNGLDSGFGSVQKVTSYRQAGNSAPVLEVPLPAALLGSYRAAPQQTVTAVSITGPAGTATLQNTFGFFVYNAEFVTPAALDAAAPAGNYTINATGAGSAVLALGAAASVPAPRLNNLSEMAAMNAAQAFTLQFGAFAGAGPGDSITISIASTDGASEFSAPNQCKGIELPVTATSLVIPANTFKAGQTLRGSISFSRFSFNTNAIPNTSVSAGVTATTNFELTLGGGGQPSQPRFTGMTRNPNGTIRYTITGDAGTTVVIQGTERFAQATQWTPVSTNLLAGGTAEFTVDPANPAKRYFRAVAR